MIQLSNQEKLKPWKGIVLFALGVLFLLFLGSYLQNTFGIPGLILSELGFLALSVIYCLINKVSLKEVFPIKKITLRDLFGVVFMFIGGFLLNYLCLGISIFVWDKLGRRDFFSEITALSDFLFGSGLTYIALILVVAVTPAICEEAFMRGAILSSFRGLKKDRYIIFIVGVMFGILHLSPLRFLNTAALGCVLAYIMVKKNNILLPMLLHFLNNFIPSVLGVSQMSDMDSFAERFESIDSTALLGTFLLISFMFPFFLVLGNKLLDKEGHKGIYFLYAGIISAVLLISGTAILFVSSGNMLKNNAILNWNYSFEVTEDSLSAKDLAEAGITIDEEKDISIVVTATAKDSDITFTITDSEGEVVYTNTGHGTLIVSENGMHLAPGEYTLFFTGDESMIGKKIRYQVVVM